MLQAVSRITTPNKKVAQKKIENVCETLKTTLVAKNQNYITRHFGTRFWHRASVRKRRY